MRKGLLLLSAAFLLAAAPSVASAQNENSAKLVRDGFGQIFVPFQSAGKAAEPAKAKKSKKAKRSKRKGKKAKKSGKRKMKG
jgi:ribosomal protein L9